ncbi:hypothetical protein HDU93_005049, partial [Gonapodya sp. JEL0774]
MIEELKQSQSELRHKLQEKIEEGQSELRHKLQEKIEEGQSELRHKLEENFEKLEEDQIELRRLGEIQQLQANLAVFVIKLSPIVQADQSMSLSKFDLKKTSFAAMAFPDQVGLDDEPTKVRSHTWLTNVAESDPIQRV